MILILDTTRGTDIRVGLKASKLISLRRRYDRPGSHVVGLIDEVLRSAAKTTADISGIIVATGPGPFSAIRAGVSVANALSFSLKLPAVGVSGEKSLTELLKAGEKKLARVKIGTIISPTYGQPPNISKKR